MTGACADIVARDDPRLFKTALFAPEAARGRLMVLYAFDIELSRATRASAESLIPRMRLQWWRDVVGDAEAGALPKAHEVAGPLAALIQGHGDLDLSADLQGLVDAHEQVLDLPWPRDQQPVWRFQRFQRLVSAAARLLTGQVIDPPDVTCLADAFALRHAAAMARAGGHVLIPGVIGQDLAALSHGTLTETARTLCTELAAQGLDSLCRARQCRIDRRIVPALLPVLWAERTLRMVARDPDSVIGGLDDIDRPFDGLRLAWRAVTGRW